MVKGANMYKCDYCHKPAKGAQEAYYHDGGILYVRPCCDDCGISFEHQYKPSQDPDERPESTYTHIPDDRLEEFFRALGPHSENQYGAWHAIGLQAPEESYYDEVLHVD